MKKAVSSLIILLLMVSISQSVHASSDFTLNKGEISADYEDLLSDRHCFVEVMSGLEIAAVYSQKNENYILSGTNSAKKSFQANGATYTPSGTAEVSGTFDPLTGGFYGTFRYDQTVVTKSNVINMTEVMFDMDGEFTAISNPDDRSVRMTFSVTNKRSGGYTKDYMFAVTFAVEGSLPFSQTEPKETQTEQVDSNIRIKEIAAGKLYIKRAGSEKPEEADADTVIYVGDTIVSPKDGKGAVLGLDSYNASEFYIRPGTELTIKSKQQVITLGEVLLKLGKATSDWLSSESFNEDFEIETNRANTSIKGTIIVLKDDGLKTILKVLEGVAELKDKANGTSVLVKAGEKAAVDTAGLSKISTFDEKAELASWEKEFGPLEQGGSEVFPLWLIIALAGVAMTIVVVVVAAIAHAKKRARVAAMRATHYQTSYHPGTLSDQTTGYQQGFCPYCGSPKNPANAFCTRCGSKLTG